RYTRSGKRYKPSYPTGGAVREGRRNHRFSPLRGISGGQARSRKAWWRLFLRRNRLLPKRDPLVSGPRLPKPPSPTEAGFAQLPGRTVSPTGERGSGEPLEELRPSSSHPEVLAPS